MPEERIERRYCGLVQLKKFDTSRLSSDVPQIMTLFERWSKGEKELLCRSVNGELFGFLFKSSKPAQMMMTEFQSCTGTTGEDSFIIFDIGDEFSGFGFSRAWTWLQHH
jgi:hypothetical protein